MDGTAQKVNAGAGADANIDRVQQLIDAGPMVILALAILAAVVVAYKILPPLVQLYVDRRRKELAETTPALADPSIDTSKSQRTILSEAWVDRMEERGRDIHRANEHVNELRLRVERAERSIAILMRSSTDMREKHEELRVRVEEIAGDVKELKARQQAADERACRIEDNTSATNSKLDRLLERFWPSTPPTAVGRG